MKIKSVLIAAVVFIIVSTPACVRNRYGIRLGDKTADISVKRLEQDLFAISPASIPDTIGYLKRKYGSFLEYFSYVINIGEVNDSMWGTNLLHFCTDRLNNEVYASVMDIFPDVEEIENELETAFRYYRHYFPEKDVPAVFTCITGFNNSLITGDSVLAIGLDRYLGSESMYYEQLGLFKYQTARMNPENILPDCMYGWASSEWIYDSIGYSQDNVLSDMIHEGKLLYFTRCMLPDEEIELITGFSQDQLRFCRQNEGRMWRYLVENDLLFRADQLTRRKLTGSAAFTTYFSTESPGRAAAWIGLRIIESFMARNRGVSLSNLMVENDIQHIIEKAGYRPAAD